MDQMVQWDSLSIQLQIPSQSDNVTNNFLNILGICEWDYDNKFLLYVLFHQDITVHVMEPNKRSSLHKNTNYS